MSLYNFLPSRPRTEALEAFVTWNDGFTANELEEVKKICAVLQLEEAKVGNGDNSVVDSDVRRTKIGWIKNQAETSWLYDRIAFIARNLNSQFYRYNLYGFVEDLQYTLYEEGNEGFYTWHIDQGAKTNCPRKLSLVIQLSEPEEYEGGEL
jgi:PKHD-type hydroxylase